MSGWVFVNLLIAALCVTGIVSVLIAQAKNKNDVVVGLCFSTVIVITLIVGVVVIK